VIAQARLAAFEALRAVDRGGVDLPVALTSARARLKDERDRALASELVIGALRWRGELDHVIAAQSHRPVTRLDADVLDILRLATYQLLHLQRVPASAAVDDAVDLTRRSRKSSAAGFVNAVLRGINRTKRALPLPARPELPLRPDTRSAALDYLSVTLSHPRWLVERWLDRWGFEDVESWCRFNNDEAPLTIRANTLKVDRASLAEQLSSRGVTTRPARWAAEGLVIVEGNALRSDLAREGLFVVQDEASQVVPALGGVRPGDRILDACAAPGGKTLALAAAAGPSGFVVAGDVRSRRIELLRHTLRVCRAENAVVVRLNLEQRLPFGSVFDVVLVDAPCSGLGTIRRDPDIRWRRRLEHLKPLATAQLMMIRNAAATVRPGGRLVYATCSSEPDENEAVIDAFLADAPPFRSLSRGELIAALPSSLGPLVNAAGFLQTWPWKHQLEAFFGAVLVRSYDL
jgi:16S rRNA (cytosine967-C5)-methyltransferase